MIWNHIVIDVGTGNASYFGRLAQPYAYKPALRKRLTEIESNHGENRFFVMNGETIIAGQSTIEGARRYLTLDRVLVELA